MPSLLPANILRAMSRLFFAFTILFLRLLLVSMSIVRVQHTTANKFGQVLELWQPLPLRPTPLISLAVLLHTKIVCRNILIEDSKYIGPI